ncbi:hypothetical protein CPB85DRAFT_1335226 [Mucidula mucida]|nr:hypothetical protein CPB85DRAFT_1335226 [Mucidula mucida]
MAVPRVILIETLLVLTLPLIMSTNDTQLQYELDEAGMFCYVVYTSFRCIKSVRPLICLCVHYFSWHRNQCLRRTRESSSTGKRKALAGPITLILTMRKWAVYDILSTPRSSMQLQLERSTLCGPRRVETFGSVTLFCGTENVLRVRMPSRLFKFDLWRVV